MDWFMKFIGFLVAMFFFMSMLLNSHVLPTCKPGYVAVDSVFTAPVCVSGYKPGHDDR